MKKLLLIVNPISGKLIVQPALLNIIEEFCRGDFLVTTRITACSGDATEWAHQAAQNGEYDLVVCCGGDGTLNEVLSGIVKSGRNVPVGYIPTGSTNDFASSMKIPTEPILAAQSIVQAQTPVCLDIGKFNSDRYFSYIASFGAFTATSYSVPQNVKNSLGHFAYVLAGIKDATSIKPYPVKAVCPQHTCEGDYIFGAVSNSLSVGGVIKLDSKTVNLCDGVFEVLFVKQPQNPIQLNKILWGLINTDFSDSEVFDFFKTEKITLNMPKEADWSLDGEFAKGCDTVKIENIHSAIRLLYNPEH